MGDRISIQFKTGNEKSVALFSHWGGQAFLEGAMEYAKRLKVEVSSHEPEDPLDRLEPNTVMVDFIRSQTSDMDRLTFDLYLGATPLDGDNFDNGNHIIDFDAL